MHLSQQLLTHLCDKCWRPCCKQYLVLKLIPDGCDSFVLTFDLTGVPSLDDDRATGLPAASEMKTNNEVRNTSLPTSQTLSRARASAVLRALDAFDKNSMRALTSMAAGATMANRVRTPEKEIRCYNKSLKAKRLRSLT